MFKYNILILSAIWLMTNTNIKSQTPDAFYGFSNCTFVDSTSSYMDAVPGLNGAPSCTCGVKGEALEFTGGESLEFPDLDLVFKEDFTMSFYFWLKGDNQVMDIMSISRDSCFYDSVFTIKYLPALQQIKVDIIETGSKRISLTGDIQDNLCWHHIVITNNGDQYDLYLDNYRVDNKEAITRLNFHPEARVKLSGNPCNGVNQNSFNGLIDEFVIWERSLDVEEINAININPDKIISNDQTIFLGEQVQINTGGTCSNNFSWNPTDDILNPGALNPLVEPTESRSYILEINYPTCEILDTINIYVLDLETLDCNELLLPNAFTPNNDGLNETYGISNVFIMEDLKSFEIYDRWSNTVFKTNNIDERWDGNFNDIKLSPGLFVYKVSYTCKQKTYVKTGSFTLLR